MRLGIALLVLIASACEAPNRPVASHRVSSCAEQQFEQSSFIVCRPRGAIEIRGGHRDFASLGAALGARADSVDFAMNAGMFDEAGAPIGLMVEDGREVHAINRRKGGGNFHLLPNGVFLMRRNGRAQVVASDAYRPSPTIAFATQSGPMLVIDGTLHPAFNSDGDSRYVRNAVGIGPDGAAVFVITQDVVSFGKLARFFRDQLKTTNALYLDGSVSSLWDPANDRLDNFTPIGPIVIAFKRGAESAPGPSTPARP